MLESLFYLNENGKTPLDILLDKDDEDENVRSVNIILKFLAKFKFNSAQNFQEHFPHMLEYKNFGIFIDEMFFQNQAMREINTVKCYEVDSGDIIA